MKIIAGGGRMSRRWEFPPNEKELDWVAEATEFHKKHYNNPLYTVYWQEFQATNQSERIITEIPHHLANASSH